MATESKIQPDLKKFMRMIAQPVTIITSADESILAGMTVSSFTCVSLHPPLILVCLSKTAPSLGVFAKRKAFVVNLLGTGQDFLAERFAGKHQLKDKFSEVTYMMNGRGLPFLTDSAGVMDCNIKSIIDAGDHWLILGIPLEIRIRAQRNPLVYFDQQYCHVVDKAFLILPEDYMTS